MKFPTPKDMAGINSKLDSIDKIGNRMEKTKDQDELVEINDELKEVIGALDKEVKSFVREFDEAAREAEMPAIPKARVKLEPDQVKYVKEHTGEILGFVEVDSPRPNETLPYTKDQITYFAIQEGKAQAERRKGMADVKKAKKESERINREADEERKKILQEIAERDPEAAAKLAGGGE